jgi:ectoine hydroxylase-related dioxygenase (phytanoyl-CoA dioxygenase family)
MTESDRLHENGYVLLRQVIPREYLANLRTSFEDGVLASHQWPVPRGIGWRHAQLDLDPWIQKVCQLPQLVESVGTLIGERFFLAQVEGREPLAGEGYQTLHRDFSADRPGDTVVAIAFFDDFGPHNGATRIIPSSHRLISKTNQSDNDESKAIQISGSAGDILVFDADLLHGASTNVSGERRRSILATYFAEPCLAMHMQSAQLRAVRMQPRWFDV